MHLILRDFLREGFSRDSYLLLEFFFSFVSELFSMGIPVKGTMFYCLGEALLKQIQEASLKLILAGVGTALQCCVFVLRAC